MSAGHCEFSPAYPANSLPVTAYRLVPLVYQINRNKVHRMSLCARSVLSVTCEHKLYKPLSVLAPQTYCLYIYFWKTCGVTQPGFWLRSSKNQVRCLCGLEVLEKHRHCGLPAACTPLAAGGRPTFYPFWHAGEKLVSQHPLRDASPLVTDFHDLGQFTYNLCSLVCLFA